MNIQNHLKKFIVFIILFFNTFYLIFLNLPNNLRKNNNLLHILILCHKNFYYKFILSFIIIFEETQQKLLCFLLFSILYFTL